MEPKDESTESLIPPPPTLFWKKKEFWRRLFRIALISGAFSGFAFFVWIGFLYNQLEKSFLKQEDFIPTRIYSDVVQISLGQTRKYVQRRLDNLSYRPERLGETLRFTLHPITYPSFLIPENHPVLDLLGKPVDLLFDGTDGNAVLIEIQTPEGNLDDLYLEPELVATLARGSSENEIREIVRFEDIPAPVWKAFIAIEDQHYLEHKGLDPRGFARALWVNLKTLSFKQGGSTITQQLVKNLMMRRDKNVLKKLSEIFLALLLEIRYPKEKILERYLNEVYLGQIGNFEIHGISEGAKYFYGKRIEDLHLGEIALMAGLIRGPGYYSPYRHLERALTRQKLVLQKMVETGQIAQTEADRAAQRKIRLTPPVTAANKAPYFTDFVKAELIRMLDNRISETEITHAGFRVYTTLDTELNDIAQESVYQGMLQLERNVGITEGSPYANLLEGALATVDHSTGYIRALVGGRDYRKSTFNRILNMKRQVGSTFKPIVYFTAFQQGNDPQGVPFGPGYPIEDAPWTLIYNQGTLTWSPKNYTKEHRGWVTLRTALTHSINVIAAKLGNQVGIDKIIENAKLLGVQSELPAVPSLTLGVAELSPVEVLRVYATFANRGHKDELTVIRGITLEDGSPYARFIYRPKPVITQNEADLMTDVLRNVFTDGTAHNADLYGFTRPAAGKTGTTTEHRDAWFSGYTPQLTTVVWVGVDQGSTVDEKGVAQVRLSGAGSALPIWIRFMKKALENSPVLSFPENRELATVLIDLKSGKRATSDCPDSQVLWERYLPGRVPKEEDCAYDYPPSAAETIVE